MEETIVNSNIDLFVDGYYNQDKQFVISILIAENNQVIKTGTFSKDTKSNITRFLSLYSSLHNPFVVSNKLPEFIENIYNETMIYHIENSKLFYDFYHSESFFIDTDKNVFLKTENHIFRDDEEFLILSFMKYLNFFYNIKHKYATNNNYNETFSNEYLNKIHILKHYITEHLKEKNYYETILKKMEGLV